MNFCTLFNKDYLARGLLLYESLEEQLKDGFKLYVYTFDYESYDYLRVLKLKNLVPIKLEDFENNNLKNIKKDRSAVEYFWTCTPFIIDFSLETYQIDHCIYLDADLFFFNSPQLILNELSENHSILITEHDYYYLYDQSETSGKYCVQFLYFKNDHNGKKALSWWKTQCLNWCYNRHEDGKFGDQKYIEQFPELFEGVHVLQNNQMALAPWNVRKYLKFAENNFPVFYHYHAVKYLKNKLFFLGYYKLNRQVVDKYYRTYLVKLYATKLLGKQEISLSYLEKVKIIIKNWFNFNHTLKV